jgi:hypothetical protein
MLSFLIVNDLKELSPSVLGGFYAFTCNPCHEYLAVFSLLHTVTSFMYNIRKACCGCGVGGGWKGKNRQLAHTPCIRAGVQIYDLKSAKMVK